MAMRKHNPGQISHLLWKLGLITLSLALIAQIFFIWLGGEKETANSLADGRRLLISLADSKIEGKIISSAPEKETKPEGTDQETTQNEQKPEEKPPEEAKPEETKPEETKPEETKPEETKPEETKPEETKPEEQKTEEQQAAIPEPEIISTVTYEEEKEEKLPDAIDSETPPADFSKDFSEKTEFGTLPKITDKGGKPWKYYSKPITIKNKNPLIAVIVSDLGKNRKNFELARRLPEQINLSFSPYAPNIDSLMLSAAKNGHELLLDLPMEAANYPATDPGPLGLLVSKDQAENETKIKKIMARNVGFIGFLTPHNEAFLENNELLKSLLQVISGRGLAAVIGKEPQKNETKEIIEQGNTANIIVDTPIDEELTKTAIDARLSLLEQTAKQQGYAVGTARAYPITITQLNEWAAKAEKNKFNLVPVSVIISKRY